MSAAYESDQAKADALSNALMDLPDEWVICRDMRHAWEVENDFHVTAGNKRMIREVQRILSCLRCRTERTETYHLATNGGLEKVHQRYTYPDHYQLKGVPRGNKPSSIIQAEQFRRAMDRVTSAKRAVKNG